MDASSQSIDVHFYAEDPNNLGVYTFIGFTTANQYRLDVNQYLNISGNHGYSFTVPVQFRYMNIYAFGINIFSGTNTLLSNCPKVVHPDVIKDVRYSFYMDALTNRELELDFYGNDFDGYQPLIVMVHGGGFMSGDKSSLENSAWRLADAGFKVACINYRLMGSPDGTGININTSTLCFGGQINDIAWYWAIQDLNAAIKFLVYNSGPFKVDPKGIFIYGESAGAITTLQLAYASEQEIFNQLGGAALFLGTWFLGDLDHSTHPPCQSVKYTIAGVGSVAGALMRDAFLEETEETPVVMLHSPCDKLVRYDVGLGYFGTFHNGIPTSCTHMEWGSKYIIDQMDQWAGMGFTEPCHKLYTVCSTHAYGNINGVAYPDHGLSGIEVVRFRQNIFKDFAIGIYNQTVCNGTPSIEALPGAFMSPKICDDDFRCTDVSSPFYHYRLDKILDDITAIDGISCGPNPASDQVTIKLTGVPVGNIEVNLLNTLGELVYSSVEVSDDARAVSKTIAISKLPQGLYFISVKGEGYFKRTTFIKTN